MQLKNAYDVTFCNPKDLTCFCSHQPRDPLSTQSHGRSYVKPFLRRPRVTFTAVTDSKAIPISIPIKVFQETAILSWYWVWSTIDSKVIPPIRLRLEIFELSSDIGWQCRISSHTFQTLCFEFTLITKTRFLYSCTQLFATLQYYPSNWFCSKTQKIFNIKTVLIHSKVNNNYKI